MKLEKGIVHSGYNVITRGGFHLDRQFMFLPKIEDMTKKGTEMRKF